MKNKTVSWKRPILVGVAFLGLLVAAIVIPLGIHAVNFDSTQDPNLYPMLDSFQTLPQATLDDNDAKVIAINNAADAQEQQDALDAAQYPSTRGDLSNTKYLGAVRDAYIAANQAGEVPLVNQLLAQNNSSDPASISLDDEWASSGGAKARYGYQRPVCRLGASIHNYSNQTCPTSLSFPSGHSRIAFLEGVTLAAMLPEVAPQVMARSAEIANYRAVLGVHYPLDIMGGRMVATRMVAYRLHDDVWRAKFEAARTQLRNAIETRCGMSVAACYASNPTSQSGVSLSAANALTAERDKLTYGFTRVGAAGQAFQAPTYAYELLSYAFPTKTQAQLEAILASTAIDSGYPLDTTGTAAGAASIGWSRLDLGAALSYADAPNPTDTTAPTVSITAPANSATVSGTATVTATASDDTGVTKVEFYVDGALANTDTSSPYSFNWDTTAAANGSHALTAKAFDAANNQATSTAVTVTVNNGGGPVDPSDTTAPTVSITAPASSSTVSGAVSVTATASDNVGVTKVEFYVDGALANTDTSSPYAFGWDTTVAASGSHALTAKAFDAAGNQTTSTAVTVTVNNAGNPGNPTDPPALNFALPGAASGSGQIAFAVAGTCASTVSNKTVAAIPESLKDKTVLVGASFSVTCGAPSTDAQVVVQLEKTYAPGTLKVFKTAGNAAPQDITDTVTITTATVSGETVSTIHYTLRDGGFGDADGVANSVIDDPIFVAFTGTAADVSGGVPKQPDTGFRLFLSNPITLVASGVASAFVLLLIGRKFVRR